MSHTFVPSPPVRIGTRDDFARLARHALADLLTSLGDPCAAIVARAAKSPEDWAAVAKNARGLVGRDDCRTHDAKAAQVCAEAMGRGHAIDAAFALARVTGEDLGTEWHARVSAELAAETLRASIAQTAQMGAVSP